MKEIHLSYHDIHTDSIKLAKKIKKKYNPKKILITSQDGLIPGNIIANYLNIENIEFINLKISPTNKINNDEIKKFIISKKEILIIDSLICTDRTTEGIRKKMPKSKIAVLYTKTKCKNKKRRL